MIRKLDFKCVTCNGSLASAGIMIVQTIDVTESQEMACGLRNRAIIILFGSKGKFF